MRPQTEEFALDGERTWEPGHWRGVEGVKPGHARRRSALAWRRSPWPWVAAAIVLVAAGALVSPRGEQHPEIAWTTQVDAGSNPGAWLVQDRLMVVSATGVQAFDPANGWQVWTVSLDDPTCTSDGESLTCVDAGGADATITTIGSGGLRHSFAMPGAQVAATVGTDVVVARLADNLRWLGRYRADGGEALWEQEVQDLGRTTWTGVTVGDGVVIAHASASHDAPGAFDVGAALSLDTGEPALIAVTHYGLTTVLNTNEARSEGLARAHLPVRLALAQLDLPGHPEAVVTLGAVRVSHGGSELLNFDGDPIAAVGSQVYTTDVAPGTNALHAYHVSARGPLWESSLTDGAVPTCPCAASARSFALVTAEDLMTGPFTLTWFDRESGRRTSRVDISPDLHALVADHSRFYVLIDGTLTAYRDPTGTQ